MSNRILTMAVLMALICASATPLLAGKMYWRETVLDTSNIKRAQLNGAGVEIIMSCSVGCGFGPIAIDIPGRKIYYVVAGSPALIGRANLDGSGQEEFIGLEGMAWVTDLAIDPVARDLYYVQPVGGLDAIIRVALDLSGTDVIVDGMDGVRGVNVDPAGKIYWTEESPTRLRRANLDGSSIEDLATGTGIFQDTTLDLATGTVYWIDGNEIRRASLDGSSPGVVPVTLSGMNGLAFETESGHVYVSRASDTEPFEGDILRVDPGSGGVDVILTDMLIPAEIAIDPEDDGPDTPATSGRGAILAALLLLAVATPLLVRRP